MPLSPLSGARSVLGDPPKVLYVWHFQRFSDVLNCSAFMKILCLYDGPTSSSRRVTARQGAPWLLKHGATGLEAAAANVARWIQQL